MAEGIGSDAFSIASSNGRGVTIQPTVGRSARPDHAPVRRITKLNQPLTPFVVQGFLSPLLIMNIDELPHRTVVVTHEMETAGTTSPIN